MNLFHGCSQRSKSLNGVGQRVVRMDLYQGFDASDFDGPKINMAAVCFQDEAYFRINTLLKQRPLRVRGMGSLRPTLSLTGVIDPLTGRDSNILNPASGRLRTPDSRGAHHG